MSFQKKVPLYNPLLVSEVRIQNLDQATQNSIELTPRKEIMEQFGHKGPLKVI